MQLLAKFPASYRQHTVRDLGSQGLKAAGFGLIHYSRRHTVQSTSGFVKR